MRSYLSVAVALLFAAFTAADVGDPQLRSNHPWYPGELACSTFERLFETQAALYQRVTGKKPTSDQDKALAAWLWRNTHYWHGEEGVEDLWGKGFTQGGDTRSREYWTGMFAHGFGLCGTTHSQWVAEMQELLGHNRGRAVGTAGHSSFEVFLTGGSYRNGKWVLLDHDISTVIFDKDGKDLLSLAEIQPDWRRLTNRQAMAERQNGWLVCGLHPDDGGVYAQYKVAEYFAGYSGPPPIVHLRRGETLRRYFEPGLEDGQTFVFWGRNYSTRNVPGPERAHTWVNQPEKMYQSKTGAGYKPGQARYANAVYTYRPDFATVDYKEGVLDESDRHVTLEFYTPYIIAATPSNMKAWGIYDEGCRNGLVLKGRAAAQVAISVDQGKTWRACGAFTDGMDLTDQARGHRQYLLRIDTGAKNLRDSGLTITTVCQVNSSVLPRLRDNGTKIDFAGSGRAVVSAGPNLPQAEAHVTAGKFGTPNVTLELATPRGEDIVEVYAAAHILSSSPPQPAIKYAIDVCTDGKVWQPMVKDWTIPRRGDEPADFWSQSFCWGSKAMENRASKVQIRFRNTGGKRYARCEAHLVYRTRHQDGTKVTYNWTDNTGKHQADHVYPSGTASTSWQVPTGTETRTHWVEFATVSK